MESTEAMKQADRILRFVDSIKSARDVLAAEIDARRNLSNLEKLIEEAVARLRDLDAQHAADVASYEAREQQAKEAAEQAEIASRSTIAELNQQRAGAQEQLAQLQREHDEKIESLQAQHERFVAEIDRQREALQAEIVAIEAQRQEALDTRQRLIDQLKGDQADG